MFMLYYHLLYERTGQSECDITHIKRHTPVLMKLSQFRSHFFRLTDVGQNQKLSVSSKSTFLWQPHSAIRSELVGSSHSLDYHLNAGSGKSVKQTFRTFKVGASRHPLLAFRHLIGPFIT